ncbi:hypothetical protein GCM10009682_29660 [Luedemannella flava]|uniref:Uncharacterized protein n=1 Tax=Luedemannella flava TaxID=349316 RepID=A0ABN2M168_9ACTN
MLVIRFDPDNPPAHKRLAGRRSVDDGQTRYVTGGIASRRAVFHQFSPAKPGPEVVAARPDT